MKCLYGDSTPAPLSDDFLDVLRDLTRACVALLRSDEAIGESRERTRQLDKQTTRDQRWLAALGKSVIEAIQSQDDGRASTAALREAERVAESARKIVEVAQQRVGTQRDAVIRELESTLVGRKRDAAEALEAFLLSRHLPDTVWGITWSVEPTEDLSVRAEAIGVADCGLEVRYLLQMPENHPWGRSVRVGDLTPELAVDLPAKKSGKLRRERLGKLYIVGADLSPRRVSLTLLRKLREVDKGFELARGPDGDITIRALEDAALPGAALAIVGPDGQEADALLTRVAGVLGPLVDGRARVLEAKFGPASASQVPGDLARAMIEAVAPSVREIVKRSASKQELCLKRDLGDHRREELFLPAAELVACFDRLPPSQRVHFDAFGLTKTTVPPRSPVTSDQTDPDIAVPGVDGVASSNQ